MCLFLSTKTEHLQANYSQTVPKDNNTTLFLPQHAVCPSPLSRTPVNPLVLDQMWIFAYQTGSDPLWTHFTLKKSLAGKGGGPGCSCSEPLPVPVYFPVRVNSQTFIPQYLFLDLFHPLRWNEERLESWISWGPKSALVQTSGPGHWETAASETTRS